LKPASRRTPRDGRPNRKNDRLDLEVNGFWWIEFTDGTVATIEATAVMDILPAQTEAA
jgi:hypothetical protein